jgi:hypothetical protein
MAGTFAVNHWRWIAIARWLTGQSDGALDSPVNYSGARLRFPESGWLAVRCAIFQHTQVLCSISN